VSEQPGHKGRKDLAGEHPFGDAGQLILLIVFLVVWVGDSFVFRFSTFLAHYFSLFVRIPLGVLFLIGAWYFAREGMRIVFGEERAEPAVIGKGVFSRVRHPVYLGCILFYIGLVVFTLSLFSALVCVAIMIFYHYISRYEEELLSGKFGKEYEQYKKSVPMWIPRV
jgi:protein-S-isoprenylcysteine O-methyltransferase Ste14